MITLQEYINECLTEDQLISNDGIILNEGFKDIVKRLAVSAAVAAAVINPLSSQVKKTNIESDNLNQIATEYRISYEQDRHSKCDVVCGLPCNKLSDSWTSCMVSLWTLLNGTSEYSNGDLTKMGEDMITKGCIKDIRQVSTPDGKFITMFAINKNIATKDIDQKEVAKETIEQQDKSAINMTKYITNVDKAIESYKRETGKDCDAVAGGWFKDKQSAYNFAELELATRLSQKTGSASVSLKDKIRSIKTYHRKESGKYQVVLIVDKGVI